MTLVDYASCIRACHACAVACDDCAAACAQAPGSQNLQRCIELSSDCADVCRLTALLMTRESAWAGALCGLCARLCLACAEQCQPHCQECAQTCQHCADECEAFSRAN